ncbi:transcription termination factor Rho [Mycobacterium sp. 1245111.1]|uniref:transcription termination factor Rho n=1 Tax=Mycobacterium sp. 1245111.1 TaxID=1834073 RepID=UPI0035111CB9
MSNPVTPDTSSANDAQSGASDGSLATMVLPELRALANRSGVKGTSGMRKSELIAAIRESRQGGHSNGAPTKSGAGESENHAAEAAANNHTEAADNIQTARTDAGDKPSSDDSNAGEKSDQTEKKQHNGNDKPARDRQDNKSEGRDSDKDSDKGGEQGSGGQPNRGGQNNQNNQNQNDDDGEGRGGRRGRRFRERRRRGDGPRDSGGGDTELREDDVVQPVAGILDVLDNYAFVRTSGYLAGPHDVYVSMNMVRKNGLRRGDAVTGAVRVPKDGEQPNQRQKFNPLVRLDTVNGGPVENAKNRPDFTKLTPLYPNQRLRLETTGDRLTTRVIDLIMPIGKGQRALIVSPPKAGKTTILQDIANAITKNNPECHLMVVLVDERPEEVTDMTRSVKGEVIASTFDRPPTDHTAVAELAIERAKRLVEQGKDVVVLLDSITRLGRAYNNASPASGRILSGGVDSTALYPPKRFLGAARNIEEGGSLTIIATAMVETGSTGDTVIFEEFKGTGNAELKLDRKISERRVFPAVDVNPSGTRKDELLLSPDEFSVVHKLRRVLSGLDSHQAIDLLMSQLRKTKNNYEFLVQVSKTTPGMDND